MQVGVSLLTPHSRCRWRWIATRIATALNLCLSRSIRRHTEMTSELLRWDVREHPRTPNMTLGVKWSQVQILSARLSARPRSQGFTCGYSFHEVASWDRLGPIWDQYSNRYSNPQRLRPPRWTSQMVNATEATTAIMSRIWVVIALIYR